MRNSLVVLIASVVADGKIDDAEVAAIRAEIYADGKIEKEEVEALFQMNDACSDNAANSKDWPALLADAVCDCVLKDDTTPGVVDKDEATWLVGLLMADGGVDETEKHVLSVLKSKATAIEPEFLAQLTALGI